MPTATLILNTKAGTHLSGGRHNDADRLREAGFELIRHPGSIDAQIAASLEQPSDIVIADGGDGTIRSVIAAHRARDVPIGILPGGTMNLLARDYGVPVDRDAALDVIAAGHTQRFDIATVNGEIFLHSAAVGLPVRIGVHRERARGRMALSTKAHLATHAARTLWRDKTLLADITDPDGTHQHIKSQSLVVVLGTVSGQLLPRPVRTDITDASLSVFPLNTRYALRIGEALARTVLGGISGEFGLNPYDASALHVTGPRRRHQPKLRFMLDGEKVLVRLPATVQVERSAIRILTTKDNS